jgi:hypothetical protein
MVHRERQLRLQFALPQQPNAVEGPGNHARRQQRLRRHRLGGIETLGIDRLLDALQVYGVVTAAVGLVEAALGQPAVDRHLAALEARLGPAGTRRLALAAAPAGLAEPGAEAAAHPLAGFARPW